MSIDLALYLESAGARRASGGEHIMGCPFCGKGRHLYINVGSDDGKPAGRWICFRCGEASRQFAKLYAQLEGVSLAVARREAARMLVGPINAPWAHLIPKPVQPAVAPDGKWLPEEFESCWDGKCWHWPEYLTERQVSRESARKFKLGFCRSGEFAGRIVFPMDCPAGRGFTARTVWSDETLRYSGGPGSGRLLFGWQTVKRDDRVVVCEGPFDAIRIAEAGYQTVSIQGKVVRDAQLSMLERFANVVIALDSDATKDAVESASKFRGRATIALIDGDPGEASLEHIGEAVETSVAPELLRKAILRHSLTQLSSRFSST